MDKTHGLILNLGSNGIIGDGGVYYSEQDFCTN
jgi:hypothetical protein